MLNHPNLTKLHEIIENTQTGKVYLIMELADKGEYVAWDEKKLCFFFTDETKKGNYKFMRKVMYEVC